MLSFVPKKLLYSVHLNVHRVRMLRDAATYNMGMKGSLTTPLVITFATDLEHYYNSTVIVAQRKPTMAFDMIKVFILGKCSNRSLQDKYMSNLKVKPMASLS